MCARYKMTGQIFCRCRRQSAACVCRDDSDHAHQISSNFARNFTAGPQLQCHVQAAASNKLLIESCHVLELVRTGMSFSYINSPESAIDLLALEVVYRSWPTLEKLP